MIVKVTNFISCIWESSELALDGSYSEAASSVWSVDSPSLDRSTTGTGGGSGDCGQVISAIELDTNAAHSGLKINLRPWK